MDQCDIKMKYHDEIMKKPCIIMRNEDNNNNIVIG